MKHNIFRKVALERLSSPDQLDQLIKVTDVKGWFVLLGLFLLLLMLLMWSIWGSISMQATGNGIIMKSGGIKNIQHVADGEIIDIKVLPGDFIHKGEVVARINLPDMVNEINDKMAELTKLENNKEQKTSSAVSNKSLLAQERINLINAMNSDKAKLMYQKKIIVQLQSAVNDTLIPPQDLYEAEKEYQATLRQIKRKENIITQMGGSASVVNHPEPTMKLSIDETIDQLKRKINRLEQELDYKSNVVSPYSGKVIEIMVNNGTLLKAGMTVMSIEPVGIGLKDLEVLLYLPSSKGKNIMIGMEVQITPSSVKKEEYGFLLGRVTSVAEFPSTFQGMMKMLGNENLVKELANNDTVIEVQVDLIPSSRTISGYKWSFPKGPPLQIQSGTLCSGTIIEKKERPIHLFMPVIKKLTE